MRFFKTIETVSVAASVAMLSACASNTEDESVIAKNDAIDDFIEVADLEELDRIRYQRDLHHKQITEDYILLYDGRDPYLLTFERRCRELNDSRVTPDFRYEADSLYARHDTYRGCRIRKLYKITPGQAAELLSLGGQSTQ